MGTEAQVKSAQLSAKKRQLRLRAMALAALSFAVFLYLETQDHLPWEEDDEPGPNNASFDTSTTYEYVDPLEHLRNCTITFQPPSQEKEEWSTKPLWFPAHPGTMEDPFHRQLITGITGLDAGGKSFYASSKGMKLKQCFGQTETATCINVHPIVDMGNKHPETRSDKFYNKIVFGLRNPMLTLPSFYNGKQIKYHGLCEGCQVPEDEWRKFRDEWLESMMDAWGNNMIDTWKRMKKYSIGMYLVNEHLWDPTRGPLVLQRLANLLKEAGFATPDEAEIPCIWLKIMGGEEAVKAHHESPYEYKDYIPSYTVAQRELMFEKLNELALKFANDTEFVDVMREYQNDIRTTARIDTASGRMLLSNSTGADDETAGVLEPNDEHNETAVAFAPNATFDQNGTEVAVKKEDRQA
eukprot:CAMPEP_0181027246 /NCGR_PEP_ID=MMETSP1070-20121207/4065_1 /TAXON_ID=265543 /ORGANISM="Minutocellus polymorphus, Strain NH13" /LENGTH=409 /DNA_ID=CAMNT_0023104481 /DNA_START=127 /DNA_END=1356 /DNA_ORIENTATION=-